MVITKVFAGGFTCACRSLASVAIVIVCQPAACRPVSWAANVLGGTTSPRFELPACAKGTIRWYIRIGTWRMKAPALGLAGVVTGTAPGTEAGSQLFTRGRLPARGGGVAGGAVIWGLGDGLA